MAPRAPGRSGTRIRLASEADCAALARLHYLSHTVSFREFADRAWLDGRDWRTYRDFWASVLAERTARDRTWVARHRGQIAGTVTITDLRSCSDAFRPRRRFGARIDQVGCLRLMYVHPSRRRQGIGSDLMRVARAYMVARGDVCASLITHAVNRPARSFYVTHGWVLDEVFEEQVPEFFDEPACMRRRARYRLRLGVAGEGPDTSAEREAPFEFGHGPA